MSISTLDVLLLLFFWEDNTLYSVQSPNPAHKAIADLEARLEPQGRKVTVVTQNIDRLHHKAGSENVIELHGEERCPGCI